jgi:hypothetical protein
MHGRWRGGFRRGEEGKWINGEMGKTKIETGKRANREKETIRAYSFSVLFLSTLDAQTSKPAFFFPLFPISPLFLELDFLIMLFYLRGRC